MYENAEEEKQESVKGEKKHWSQILLLFIVFSHIRKSQIRDI